MSDSEDGSGEVALGLILIVIGIVITAVTYSHASSEGGGRYILAFGPIIVGVIKLFRGLARSTS
jgi:uncharacterized membrane protein